MASRERFNDLAGALGSLEGYLAEHPLPALLLEPFREDSTLGVSTPSPEVSETASTTLSERLVAQQAFSQASGGLVHPDARVLWLVKSDRNPFGGMVTVGRAANNDLILPHPAISKLHAIFSGQGEDWRIQDRGSTNGTFLDGVRLPANEARDVNDGVRLRLADVVTLRFFLPESFWSFCRLVSGG